uniref:Fibronectin type-III domain-containing protein n=1 Tax=Trichobilharzia regenti TaxID=157069 RepID=A0AA85JSY9_TRIRE
MVSEIKNMNEKADDGYSLLSYLKVLPGHSDNRRLKVKWDWSSMEIAQSLLQQAKILYYNNFDVDISGQEIIQDYKVKEFDLTNLHPDTKYLICFRVTRKRFLSLDLSNNESVTVKPPPPLLLRSNITKASERNSSVNNPYRRNIVLEKTGASQLIFNDNSPLNRSHRLHSINMPKMNDEYVAEMKCQVTFTQFLHWTAILCSLIGIIIALILSITIFLVLKSRAYRTKHHDRKMFLNQKGQSSARRIGSGEDDEEDGEDMSSANKLRHPHNHPHHPHHHHHHHHHHQHPHSAYHQHHHHHCHHVPHTHNQNQQHSHHHCHLNSSKKSLVVKQEHSTRCPNHQKTKSSSSSSLSSPSCLKSSDKTGIIRDKSSRHNLTTTELVCETHSTKPNNNNNNNKTTNELHLSEKQLEDWENELKNIEESNDTVDDNTKKSIPVVKPPDVVKNNISIPTVNSVKTQKTSQSIPQDSVTLLESIESVKEMETKRTVSFKDDTPVQIQINQNPVKKDVHLTNMTSTQHSTSYDSHNDDIMYNLSKPISISARESHLIHSRHQIPENLISDGNNDSLLFNSTHSINKQVNVNKNLSYSSHNKDYNKKYEICSPLLSDIEQKPQSSSFHDKNLADNLV